MITGLRLQHEGLEFEIEMIDGKYWGNYGSNEDHEKRKYFDEFIDEKSSKNFFSKKKYDSEDYESHYEEWLISFVTSFMGKLYSSS